MIPYLEDSIIYDSLLLHGTALLLTTIVSYCLSSWVTNMGLNLQIWLSFFTVTSFYFIYGLFLTHIEQVLQKSSKRM